MKQKPYLINLIDKKKIRDYTDANREQNNGALINKLLGMLGVVTTDGDGKALHYIAVDQYINDNLGKFTYSEITEAFNMLLNGTFGDKIKVYPKLDCILLSNTMKLYKVERDRITDNYYNQLKKQVRLLENKRNELSEEEKKKQVTNGIIRVFNEYLQTSQIDFGTEYVYDELFELKLLPQEKKYRLEKLKIAQKKIKSETVRGINKQSLKDIMKGNYIGDISLAKRLIISEYFDKLIQEEKNISNILNKA